MRRCKPPGARYGPQTSREGQQQLEKNEQARRGTEAKLKQEAMRLRSERSVCPRRDSHLHSRATGSAVRWPRNSAKVSGTRDLLDADLPLGWRTRIASQTLCPREPKVRPLRERMDRRRRRRAVLAGQDLCKPHLAVLITHQLQTGASMLS